MPMSTEKTNIFYHESGMKIHLLESIFGIDLHLELMCDNDNNKASDYYLPSVGKISSAKC